MVAIYGHPRTRIERDRRNAACKELRDAGYAPEDIERAHLAWPNVMRDATETPHALAANMCLLLEGPQVHGRSNGTVLEHRQRMTEYAAVNRGKPRGLEAVDAWEPPPELAKRLAARPTPVPRSQPP